MVGILEGKRILVTGVLTDDSLAFGAARLAIEQGAEIALTGFGRGLSLTNRVARKLPGSVEVYELDVTVEDQADRVAEQLESRWGALDGVVHAIGFAPDICLGSGVLPAAWNDVATAIEVSTYSLKVLAKAFTPLLSGARKGGSIVGFDFDATVAWPGYDWMGVAKAALESLARYLARDLGPSGVRVNLIAAGPISTVAARSIPSFERFESVWDGRAPLGWDVRNSEAVAKACVALLSDWFPLTTGEIIHVDGGFHATGV
ncbi:MAG: enoyl-ACP reductase FabI [Acidimicrobiales bacterium]